MSQPQSSQPRLVEIDTDKSQLDIPVNVKSGYLPLHAALAQVDPTPSISHLRSLLRAYPEAARHVLPNGRIALHMAAGQNYPGLVQDLLEVFPQEGVRWETVDGRLPLDYAVMGKGNLETIELLIAAFPESLHRITKDESYLSMAIRHGREVEIVERLCTQKLLARRNQYGQTILHQVVQQKVLSYLNLIVNKAPKLLSIANNEGQLPLHVAAGQTHCPFAIMERLVQSHITAARTSCYNGDLPLHKLLRNHPLPPIATVLLLIDVYPEGLLHRNDGSFTPLELFHHCSRFSLGMRHYDKARTILLSLMDRTLPFHQMAESYHCFPVDMTAKIIQNHAPAATQRDHRGMYAWQVAAMLPNTPVSCVYELLRLAPITLENSRRK